MDNLNVFQLREAVVGEYRDYVESFIKIADPRLAEFVRGRLAEGELWPPAALQLNPAFKMNATLGEMAEEGIITRETARFFGEDLRLYQHQREAIDIGLRGESFVVTTGTGSGKSLAYLVPVYDAIIREGAEKIASARALLVYPMNALINSQLRALEEFQANNFPDSPVTFARYTGQDVGEARNEILRNPPHILLTNYMMAEYILTRPAEKPLLNTATRDLRTLAMDELHFYRGRQGADAAMLSRRIQETAGRDLQAIATSATMATGGGREHRRRAAAEVASKFFGLDIPPANVVDETLRPAASAPKPIGADALRAAVESPPPAATEDAVRAHPLAAWAEDAFGLEDENGRLIRRKPRTFAEVAGDLARESGAPPAACERSLRALLDAAAKMEAAAPGGRPLAFRLHQWLSSGDSVYATLEPAESRSFRMAGQFKADESRLLFPVEFCRECGQDYYLATRVADGGIERLLPRPPRYGGGAEEDGGGDDGFFCLQTGGVWQGERGDLPDFWFEESRSGVRRVKRDYADAVPERRAAKPDGALNLTAGAGALGWFQRRPFTLCLRCFAVYDRRGSDYGKLSSLSQTGRSTAATIGVNAAVADMSGQKMAKEETKALSFTDNRQDASLQAGHLNDFAQVSLLRAGVVKAIERNGGPLEFAELGSATFEALELRPPDFLSEPVSRGPGYNRGRRAMTDLLEYRALEDLSRGWRVAQPNLEQTGLLRIEYDGLAELAADESLWEGLPAIADAAPERRETVLRALLDHLRTRLAVSADRLTRESLRQLKTRSRNLRDPWRLEESDRLRERGLALMPGEKLSAQEARSLGPNTVSLGRRSNAARYLRSRHAWETERDLSAEESETLMSGIIRALRGHLLDAESAGGREVGVRVSANAMLWTAGDGTPAPPDPVRSRAAHLRQETPQSGESNRYFRNLYTERAAHLRGMEAAEHTGQVVRHLREAREKRFGSGDLPALFCSPTMELGVDIRELRAVHMRNIPPTPANYAQRGGRAGRGGRPALIVAFAAKGNAHDQYFFERRTEMISGAVAPSRMDLRNEELIKAHIHAVWLSRTGISLGGGAAEVLDLDAPAYPILAAIREDLEKSARPDNLAGAVEFCRRVARRAQDVQAAKWFSDSWIEETLRAAPSEFDKAFANWRAMYKSALDLRDAARREMDDPRAKTEDRRAAERRERQARREIDLLRNDTRNHDESDFYPYRYLASEGFLPGYNFPRLPSRISATVRDETQYIARARFLALSEFGPGNTVYHEGRKHLIHAAAPPLEGFESAFERARLCRKCGCAHFGETADADLCAHCGTRLDAETADFPQRLLFQPFMRTRVEERITSEEEERRRNGYRVTTHFALSGEGEREDAALRTPDGEAVLEILRAPAARLWRVNRGWRRGGGGGFALNPKSGEWRRPNSRASSPDDLTGVMTYATGVRNLLMLNPVHPNPTRGFALSLLHALKRAAQIVHHVEDQEIGAELIGEDEFQRLLFWEEAEGGTGVWERLLDEPAQFRELARTALELCHFNPETGENADGHDLEKCAVACYECLLTYANQLEHRYIDRNLIRDFLLKLADAATIAPPPDDDREARYRRLQCLTGSTLESDFLRFLYENGLRLPDEAQNRPSKHVYAQPDFYYARNGRPGVCVFLDGPRHDAPDQSRRDETARESLRDMGFGVIAIKSGEPFAERTRERPDVFGAAN